MCRYINFFIGRDNFFQENNEFHFRSKLIFRGLILIFTKFGSFSLIKGRQTLLSSSKTQNSNETWSTTNFTTCFNFQIYQRIINLPIALCNYKKVCLIFSFKKIFFQIPTDIVLLKIFKEWLLYCFLLIFFMTSELREGTSKKFCSFLSEKNKANSRSAKTLKNVINF